MLVKLINEDHYKLLRNITWQVKGTEDNHYRDFLPRHPLQRFFPKTPIKETFYPDTHYRDFFSRTPIKEISYPDTHYRDIFPRTPIKETSFPGHPLKRLLNCNSEMKMNHNV